MALHVNTFAALTDHFVNPFVRENVARVFEDVVRFTFESLTLTPFRIEILSVRKWIFQCFNGVFSAILVRMRKRYARISLYFFFLQFLCRYSLFFLQGEINLWGVRDKKISAPVSAPVLAL